MATMNKMPQESIIEYLQLKDSPDFQYDESSGAIYIRAEESKWLFSKSKKIKTNAKIYYDDNNYTLLIINNISKIDFKNRIVNSNTDEVEMYNFSLLPKRIKKGEIIGTAILIPKVHSHFVRNTPVIEKEV